jgi:hypothetical protein
MRGGQIVRDDIEMLNTVRLGPANNAGKHVTSNNPSAEASGEWRWFLLGRCLHRSRTRNQARKSKTASASDAPWVRLAPATHLQNSAETKIEEGNDALKTTDQPGTQPTTVGAATPRAHRCQAST